MNNWAHVTECIRVPETVARENAHSHVTICSVVTSDWWKKRYEKC